MARPGVVLRGRGPYGSSAVETGASAGVSGGFVEIKMRRRRRTKYTWLPVIGTELEGLAPGEFINKWGRSFSIGANNEGAGLVVPLTADLPRDEDIVPGDEGVLSDSIGQEWFLRRIVGKLSISWALNPGADGADQICIHAGFFVARASAADGDVPIGVAPGGTWAAGLSPQVYNSYDPGSNSTVREPWIWRRTWCLGNPDIATDTNWPRGLFPAHNLGFASSLDGPHIDAKTLRRITNDDRLWFALSANTLPLGDSVGTASALAHLDIRILGNLRKARNRGVF